MGQETGYPIYSTNYRSPKYALLVFTTRLVTGCDPARVVEHVNLGTCATHHAVNAYDDVKVAESVHIIVRPCLFPNESSFFTPTPHHPSFTALHPLLDTQELAIMDSAATALNSLL